MKGAQYNTGRASEPILRYVHLPNGALELHKVREVRFDYPTTINFTGVNQNLSVPIQLLQVADFEVFYLQDTHAQAWFVQLTDGSTNASMSSAPVPAASICGNGQLPGISPVTFVFRKAGSIVITAINGPTIAANPGVFTLVGAHLYDEGPVNVQQ